MKEDEVVIGNEEKEKEAEKEMEEEMKACVIYRIRWTWS